jgi:hypothetical protein
VSGGYQKEKGRGGRPREITGGSQGGSEASIVILRLWVRTSRPAFGRFFGLDSGGGGVKAQLWSVQVLVTMELAFCYNPILK